jgi:aspartate/methionine/tyrosine aminotransferase
MREAFERRGRTMWHLLQGIEGITCIEPQGAFYGFPNVTGVLGRSIRGHTAQTSMELAALILDEVKVAVVPGEAFAAPGYFRMSFALGDDDLGEGISRIADLLTS